MRIQEPDVEHPSRIVLMKGQNERMVAFGELEGDDVVVVARRSRFVSGELESTVDENADTVVGA
jgi:hypothetical protein